MKKKQENVNLEALATESEMPKFRAFSAKKAFLGVLSLLIVVPVVLGLVALQGLKKVSLGVESDVSLASAPVAATSVKKGTIAIPSGIVKSNPFLPYRDISGGSKGSDVPAFSLVEPPEMVNENSDAARVMDTIVSGILFDTYSPSAILNIEGNDYLVKKGDVVNNYKVIDIVRDSVTVKLGSNVYKAGIGEILTEGSLNHNDVSNLSNKFGGVK